MVFRCSRRLALGVASIQGALLAERDPADAYVRALAEVAQMMRYAQQGERASGVSNWLAGARTSLKGRFGRRSESKSADAAELDLGNTERNAT